MPCRSWHLTLPGPGRHLWLMAIQTSYTMAPALCSVTLTGKDSSNPKLRLWTELASQSRRSLQCHGSPTPTSSRLLTNPPSQMASRLDLPLLLLWCHHLKILFSLSAWALLFHLSLGMNVISLVLSMMGPNERYRSPAQVSTQILWKAEEDVREDFPYKQWIIC